MSYLPTFQPQNPELNHYSLGWSSCTAYSAAMAGDFDTLGQKVPTGQQVRTKTGDTTGGLNLSQVDAALVSGWGINLNTVYRLSWSDFAKKIDAGCGAILQGGYAPIADSRFDAGRGFRGNHAIFVAPGWVGMDPLADGRATGVYKYHGEAYPQQLLRTFAGQLVLGPKTDLGDGLVYASFTRDNVHTFAAAFTPGAFWVYNVANGIITGRYAKAFTKDTSAACSAIRSTAWPGHGSRPLVLMLSGALKDSWVQVPQAHVSLEVVP